ncbi:MAG: hypothetical protein A3C50_03215 [Candidatus Staskawiczbacteria bacterium RIFCSPHIGHO2_02_FULL_43_16]|uniref:Sortase n=1 Tax=Candidatus Staskawiczbacteria bacterium RIFCSPHIGHO2_01_FULL_41_41 TaxID=1802203 RepID=A0A1G2HTZ0_9BACT|nr:MAG: hypothetical protein A2822_03085 [Candidatus Staskawiczbacteria bacterium RIFCSPHIGHO2_01_FULL_41_41]OGZ68711.1 MAG: hypothetical protein A3C50_03215 [Candidatus Staskawiczbacteria bacterium RIFCSPHIGHO2_02_FULL_43_16]OGZ75174.1 MAG: hypothetical protein A3A12_01140 [Candidatus Staskawiczbacteria bacterium RIFCSPLOWO2_01_FULL_43_17b]
MKINQKQKELIKIYLVLFLLIFTVMNWGTVSWMFNYRAVFGLVHDFFNPYEDSRLLVSASTLKLPPKQAAVLVQGQKTYPYSAKENSIEIPSLNIVAPVVIGESTQVAALERNLDKGVVYYPGSVLPGEAGQIAVLGHSAPPNWPKIKYDWVFTHINDLSPGDLVILHFNNRQYTYKMTEKSIVKKGQEVGANGLTGKNNILTLVSCWPPGKDYQRIAVYAELQ